MRSCIFSPAGLALAADLLLHASAAGLNAPLAPETARKTFQIDPGLEVQLVASEPLAADPVAICFDERGRIFVAENRDYPTGPAPGAKPAGTIAMLEDTDGDGLPDKRTELVTRLTFPNGVMPWDGGLIVTCAPDVLYFKDTDGDGKADVRKVLFTGFNTQGSTQLRVSHPALGPDGWIYLTSGWTGANRISTPEFPDRASREFRGDCRFDPFTLELIPETSRAQFGLCFDDFGHRFICYNRVHIQHVVLPGRYLARNPRLAFSKTVQDVPENRVRDWLVSDEGFAARVYPISDNITTYDSHAGTFSAACSVHVYSGTALPAEYRGNVFACEPTGNLVHRDLLEPRGPTFGSHMAHQGREFLASPDNWFRPVFLADGPDGALYICDMYRKTIEHPDYLPPETRKHTDFQSGKGMGRIWRVVAKGRKKQLPSFANANPAPLVAHLASANGWERITAQRLILEGSGTASNAFAVALRAELSRKEFPAAGRFLAVSLLDHLNALSNDLLLQALGDSNAGVREGAIRLAEKRLGTKEIISAVLARTGDSDPRVRFQCALSLGESSDPRRIPALASMLVRDGTNEWSRAAILSSVPGNAELLLRELLQLPASADPECLLDLGRLAAKESDPRRILELARAASLDSGSAIALTDGILEGAGRKNAEALVEFAGPSHTAEKTAADAQQPIAVRKAAVDLLSLSASGSGDPLLRLLDSTQPVDLEKAAVRALARLPRSKAAAELLTENRWRALSSSLHTAIIASFMSEPRAAALLLNAVAGGQIPASAFTTRQRELLRKNSDPNVRQLALRLFAAAGGDRMKAYEAAKSVLELPAHPANGRQVFAKICSSCHRLEQQGVVVGPELVAMRHQPKEVILLHVINPNYEVAPAFAAYELETKDGRTLTGLIASESPASITLREAQGIEETVPRAEIRKLEASSLSLMPDELEKSMSRQELADLLAFLKGEK